ncbi:Twinfilin-1 [Didymella sp. IMI 355093]|nr:Twinfilin-1 [Didymella sp. IMI 355093]
MDACDGSHEGTNVRIEDLGHKKNKCRLCDRRMKNKITDEAWAALRKLEDKGDLVQISLEADLKLGLDLQITSVQAEHVSSHIPVTHPTFTFYHHSNKRLYFIFHSPDSATVQQRMKHTMAIPGLVNVHAEDCGVHIDQKIEIHEPEDLVFQEEDEKIGKFRKGDIEFYDRVR